MTCQCLSSAGLYKQLAILKDLISEHREAGLGSDAAMVLREPIVQALCLSGELACLTMFHMAEPRHPSGPGRVYPGLVNWCDAEACRGLPRAWCLSGELAERIKDAIHSIGGALTGKGRAVWWFVNWWCAHLTGRGRADW